MNRIQHATVFATQAHSGQKRKYTGENYIVHPIAVAELVREKGGSEEQIMAALLHDTVEDCTTTHDDILYVFGPVVAGLVEELTDVFTSEAYPKDNRKVRKRREAKRLAKISVEAKLIKLCDMIDNTSSIVEHDPNFAKLYLAEKLHLFQIMGLDKLNTA